METNIKVVVALRREWTLTISFGISGIFTNGILFACAFHYGHNNCRVSGFHESLCNIPNRRGEMFCFPHIYRKSDLHLSYSH